MRESEFPAQSSTAPLERPPYLVGPTSPARSADSCDCSSRTADRWTQDGDGTSSSRARELPETVARQLRKRLCVHRSRTGSGSRGVPPLYSYSALGEHHAHGGLLLRRDVHRLFDLGYLAVDPTTLTIDVAAPLSSFPIYAGLEGQALHTPVAPTHRKWFHDHWREHRTE